MKEQTKKRFLIAGKIFLTLALFIYLVIYIDFQKILITFSRAKLGTVIIILILLALNLYVQFKRWELVSQKVLKNNNRRQILSSLFHGFAWGIITPMRTGEFVARKIPMKESSTFAIVLATFVDKFLLMPVIFFIGGVLAIVFISVFTEISTYLLILISVLFLLAFVLIMLIIFNYYRAKTVLSKFVLFAKLFKKMSLNLEGFSLVGRKDIVSLLLLSFLLYLIYTSQFALSIFAFTDKADFLTCLWISNLVIFSKNFIPPVTLGEVGIREAITIYFASKFGISASVGFDAGLLIFLINILLPSLIGVYFVLREK